MHLNDEGLRDTVVRKLQIKDAVKGTVLLADVTPLFTTAFHRHWCIAQQHQEMLMRAVDLRESGSLSWEEFSMAATLVMQTLPPPATGRKQRTLEQSALLNVFQQACRMSRQANMCTLADARVKLFSTLWRLWSLEKVLPALASSGARDVPLLPASYHAEVQTKATALQSAISEAIAVRCTLWRVVLLLVPHENPHEPPA